MQTRPIAERSAHVALRRTRLVNCSFSDFIADLRNPIILKQLVESTLPHLPELALVHSIISLDVNRSEEYTDHKCKKHWHWISITTPNKLTCTSYTDNAITNVLHPSI